MADKGAAFKHRIIIVGKFESEIWSADQSTNTVLKDFLVLHVL